MDFNCYNIGYNYLKDKYGYTRMRVTASCYELSRKFMGNKKQLDEFYATLTDRDYDLKINPIHEDDKEISVLLNQYPYGIAVREELYWALFKRGAIKINLVD